MPLAGVSVGIAMVLLTLTASSGPVRIWITPTQVRGPTNDGSDPVVIGPTNPVASDRIAIPSWMMTLLVILGVLLIVLAVTALASVRVVSALPSFRWRWSRRWGGGKIAPLPEVHERELTVDVEAARAALSEGNPRNAIVACWMQLERDAAKVGLPRMAAETPAEYVERVVVASSVDPAPINELAALYREARFSSHRLGNDDRARAFDALHRVATSLKSKQEVSA